MHQMQKKWPFERFSYKVVWIFKVLFHVQRVCSIWVRGRVSLQVPFARFVAHNQVQNLRRYSVERVFRQNKPFGLHPREIVECAFDIITSTHSCSVPDAELLVMVQEVINEFQGLQVCACLKLSSPLCLSLSDWWQECIWHIQKQNLPGTARDFHSS